jgi:hypothetical protein
MKVQATAVVVVVEEVVEVEVVVVVEVDHRILYYFLWMTSATGKITYRCIIKHQIVDYDVQHQQ